MTVSQPRPRYHPAYRCLELIGRHHGVDLPVELVRAATDVAPTPAQIARMAGDMGLKAKVWEGRQWADLPQLARACPAMAHLTNGNTVILVGVTPAEGGQYQVVVVDPLTEQAGMLRLTQEQFCASWGGTIILLKRVYDWADEKQPFSLRWFVPEILKQGRHFRQVGLAALMMHLIAFGSPLLFQILIDKVIPHQSTQTMAVVVLVFIVATLFEAIFGYIRQALLLHATNKIDARLVGRTFAHLLSLPVQFFEASSAGVLTKHMQQTEKIRQFLTGKLFQTALDAMALPILIAVLLLYSVKLTLTVIVFAGLIALLIFVLVPRFRARLQRLYQAEGTRQAHLVEAIHGIRTVKALALEPPQRRVWDSKVAQSISTSASVGRMGAAANVVTHAVERLMTVAVIALGAMDVFDGTLSIGALVAFQMLSGRVTGPLVQIVGLINEYQEAALSVAMLGQVMNHPSERPADSRGLRPNIAGRLELSDVTFRYPTGSTPALDRVSFTVEAGQVIGVVGRSGSGKTTLMRLVQGIDAPQEGLIRLDGADLRQIDLPHLRSRIGVVLQENFLFRGTVRENIAATRPEASLEDVVKAARLAGAEEFIERLPRAYETMIEENGANFSGGQRQRLAIARALMAQPRLLIFDEATSALDPDTEVLVQNNLAEIAKGRTMLIVSHRLSSLTQADAILVLDQGHVVDYAPHATLLQRCDIYRHLWQQQTQYMR